MPISIKGIRLEQIAVARLDDGNYKIADSSYSLISSADKVLAKQAIGGYGGMTLEPSASTTKALNAFIDSYKADVTGVLGLEDN